MTEVAGRRGWWLGAGCEIVAPDGRLLMIEQERLGHVEWSGTGGALEEGESILDAARRETKEESGLDVRIERLISVSEFWERGRLAGVGFLFLAAPDPWPQAVRLPIVDGITRFRSYRWMSRDEVVGLEARWEHHISRIAWPADIERAVVLRLDTEPLPRIRRARADEAEVLTALTHRSKAHWGYSDAFMARAREELTITPGDIAAHEVWVLEDEVGEPIGVHHVVPGELAVLEDLWLEPSAIGRGHGRRLWEHALAIARSRGAGALELDADPNAVPFYERMGARQVGWTDSAIEEGRRLPHLRITIDH